MGEVSIEEEIKQVSVGRPHVFILGAGASLAALPKGDAAGKELPLMKNFIEVLGLRAILKKHSVDLASDNLEVIYSHLYQDPNYSAALTELEGAIRVYFSNLRLPPQPTVYDHLLLSLRAKDVVVTFNWDPLLAEAYVRNMHFCKLPSLHFLHGGVNMGVCKTDYSKGDIRGKCPKCGRRFESSPILFPIQKKNYSADPFIHNEWECVQHWLKNSFMLTIFGYGAPKSDLDAIELLKTPWNENESRQFLETEIIDIKEKQELEETWDGFFFSHHYLIQNNFYKSVVATHPRRSCEAMWNCTLEAKWIKENPIPAQLSFPDLYRWLDPLLAAEEKAPVVSAGN